MQHQQLVNIMPGQPERDVVVISSKMRETVESVTDYSEIFNYERVNLRIWDSFLVCVCIGETDKYLYLARNPEFMYIRRFAYLSMI